MAFLTPYKSFSQERKENVRRLGAAKAFKALARRFMAESFRLRYPYNFDWLGRPIIQYPQDIVAMQELVWKVKPDLIIETGIARGGSLIFYASLLELLGRGRVVGIDIEIRPHNRREIEKHKLAKRITMIEGSSVDERVLAKVHGIAKRHKTVMVCLDSSHTHDHVLKELTAYAPLVTKGSYLVAFDTIIDSLPRGFFGDRPWDKGNNPATAVAAFLKTHKNFAIDRQISDKLAITAVPGGYVRRVR